jgi:hypothetical protein
MSAGVILPPESTLAPVKLSVQPPHMNSQGAPQPPQAIVFWVLWFAILSGLLMIQFFAGGGMPSGVDKGDGPVLFQGLALGAGLIAMIVRFVVIPRIGTLEKKLPAMIIGLALSEGIGIIGAFVVRPEFGSTKLFMLAISVGCIVLSAPVYAKLGGGNSFRG